MHDQIETGVAELAQVRHVPFDGSDFQGITDGNRPVCFEHQRRIIENSDIGAGSG